MKCQFTGFYAHWVLTQAQDGTFTEVELGIEPVESKPSLSGKAAAALHTKSYLRRQAEKLVDSLRRVVTRDRAGAT
jgi:hypothetical protein